MKLEVLNLLRDYTAGINDVNRIIVTSFLSSNNISNVENEFISSLMILESDHDHDALLAFGDKLKINTFDDLIKAFEFVISPVDKVVTGAVYTPDNIRERIVDDAVGVNNVNETNIKVCDPACGCGGFLYSSALKIKEHNPNVSYYDIYKNLIFGLDLKDYSVERTKILLSLLAIVSGEDESVFDFNLYTGNALDFDWNRNVIDFDGFDVVVGNPPYVASRNIEDSSLKLLKNWKVCSTGHPDLYIPFFEIGLSILKEGGCLGFITMNTFFKSINGRALREFFGENNFKISITDFGSIQIFSSRNTYTCICLITKTRSDKIYYRKLNQLKDLDDTPFSSLMYDSLSHFDGWNLSNANIISIVERVGVPLKELYNVSCGIATLKNGVYILDIVSEDVNDYILKCGSRVEKEICVDIINPNKLVEEPDVEPLKKKIIFPYRYIDGSVQIIPNDEFRKKSPNAYLYLSKHKRELAKRDKGKRVYEEWYAYGRRQGLVKHKHKLFFPHITHKTPNFALVNQEELLFHNGLAIPSNDKESLEVLKVVMSSRLFWFYVESTSKPYGSGYYSLSRNYIKSFGIYPFSEKQKDFLLNVKEQSKIDKFIEDLYGVNLDKEF